VSLFKRAATIAAVLLVFAVSAFAQGPVITTGAPSPKVSNGAPTGACGPQDTDVDSTTGNWYVCKSGAWTLAGSGGGGSGTVSGQANGVVPLATAATTIGAQSHISDNSSVITMSLPLTVGSGCSGATGTGGACFVQANCALWTPTAGQSLICADSTNGLEIANGATSFTKMLSTAYATARDAKGDDSGTNQVQRATLDCQLGVKCTDDSTNTRTDIRQYSLLDGYYIREYMLCDPTVCVLSNGSVVGSAGVYTVSNVNGTGDISRWDGGGALTSSWRVDTGNNSSNESFMYLNCSQNLLCLPGAGNGPVLFETRITEGTSTNSYYAVGSVVNQGGVSLHGPPGSAIWCDVTNGASAGNWACHTRASSTQTDVTLSPVQTSDTNAHVLRFVIASGSVTFYFDGTSVGSSSTNIPQQTLDPEWQVETTTSSSTKIIVNGWVYEKKN
jgi:hypothetical protein